MAIELLLRLNTLYEYAWTNPVWWYWFCRVRVHHQDLGYIGYLGSPKISWHLQLSQITVYVSLPNIMASSAISNHRLCRPAKYHGIIRYFISPSIMASTGTSDHHISRFAMYAGKAGGLHVHDASKNLVDPASINRHSPCWQ